MLHWFLSTLAHLIHIASPILKTYGLSAMFLLLFVESAGVVFAPGEAMVVAVGFLSAKGVFSVWIALPLAMLAATLGGYLAYGLGTRYGHKALLKYGPYVGVKPSMVDRVHSFFHRFGVPVVMIGRFIVPLRQLQGYLAGASQMGFMRFAVWSAVGAVLWISAWGGAAFWLAEKIPV